jgi:hypothetical protein
LEGVLHMLPVGKEQQEVMKEYLEFLISNREPSFRRSTWFANASLLLGHRIYGPATAGEIVSALTSCGDPTIVLYGRLLELTKVEMSFGGSRR